MGDHNIAVTLRVKRCTRSVRNICVSAGISRIEMERGPHAPSFHNRFPAKERRMKWKKPRIVEIAVGLEINAYACADLG